MVDTDQEDTPMAKYDAFISYSHSADGELAPKIRDGLQKLAKPWNKRRALNIFLDQASLEVSAGLKAALHAKLEGTDWLILLLSRECARSEWVAAEIENWVATKRKDRVVLVHTEGELVWGEGDWDWERSTAAPRALSRVYNEEPLWLDLRKYHDAADLDIRSNPAFRDDLATLAAPLHGKSKEDLVGEDLVQFRRSRRLRRIAIASLIVLTIASITASIIALVSWNHAVLEAKVSTARRLAAQAQVEAIDQPDLAMLLAVAANDLDGQLVADGDIPEPLVEPRAALLAVLEATPQLVAYLPLAAKPTVIATATGSATLAVGDTSGVVTLWDWDALSFTPGASIKIAGGAVSALTVSDDASRLAAGTEDGGVTIWGIGSGGTVAIGGAGAPVDGIVFDDGATRLAVAYGGDDETVVVHDATTGEMIGVPFTGFIAVQALRFTGPNTLTVIAFGALNTCEIGGACVETATEFSPSARPGPSAFNIPGNQGATSQLTGGAVSFGALDGLTDLSFDLGAGFIEALEFSPDGSVLVAAHESNLRFWDTTSAEEVGSRVPGLEAGINTQIVFPIADGSRVATLAGGKVQLWDRGRQIQLRNTLPVTKVDFPRVIGTVVGADFSPDGQRVAWIIDIADMRFDEDQVSQEGETVAVWTRGSGEIITLPAEFALNDDRNLLAFRSDTEIITDAGHVWDVADGRRVDVTADCFDFGATVATDGGGLARCEGGVLNAVDLSGFGAGVSGVDLAGAALSDDGSHLAAFDVSTSQVTVFHVGPEAAAPVVIDLATDPAATGAVGVNEGDKPVLALSPNGRLLVVASFFSGDYSFFNGETKVLSQPRGQIEGLAFSPDSSSVAFDRADGGIEIRRTTDLATITVLHGDDDTDARVLQFSPDGKLLLEATVGGGLSLWTVDAESPKQRACSIAGRTLTAEERERFISATVDLDPCAPEG